MDEQLALIEPETKAVPSCPLCDRPRYWIRKHGEYARYCAHNGCSSSERTCAECGERFVVGVDGAGRKYCSARCATERHARRIPRVVDTTCAWCGHLPKERPVSAQGTYVCQTCVAPLTPVLGRLRLHRVPVDRWRVLLADPCCPLCGVDLLKEGATRRGDVRTLLVVDHDHSCCPGYRSCGKCVRGFICAMCNSLLGLAKDDPQVLRNAARYLETPLLPEQF